MTVTVRSAPGTARDVVYPDPPLPHEGSRGRADTLFRSQELVVIDLGGRVIAEERVGRRVGYDANGTLRFHVEEGSAGVYILDGPGKVGADGVWLR